MKNVDLIVLQYTCFQFQSFHASHDSFNFNFIQHTRISANLLLACTVAFYNLHRILQFEDTVCQSRYYIDTYYPTITSLCALSIAYGSPRVCQSVLISIAVRSHLHNRSCCLLIAFV